jgi:hypothetical protein
VVLADKRDWLKRPVSCPRLRPEHATPERQAVARPPKDCHQPRRALQYGTLVELALELDQKRCGPDGREATSEPDVGKLAGPWPWQAPAEDRRTARAQPTRDEDSVCRRWADH